ncbi:MAG: 50S ribosomal protein L24 [Opitutales bacterium]|nr:50S ribosomal protein L24 [Opitutales bacterium]|tara:strand:+ start:1027 stop:1281 length:255 start_codon:yes stop_codon:yes gene_type:complete
MAKRIKRGDEVVVISGSHKGKRGKVLEVQLTQERVLVEGVNLVKKHQRKTQENPEGSIIEKEASIHCSNVMSAERHDARVKKAS